MIDWLNCVSRFIHNRMLYECHHTKLNWWLNCLIQNVFQNINQLIVRPPHDALQVPQHKTQLINWLIDWWNYVSRFVHQILLYKCYNTKLAWFIDWLNCVARFVHHMMLYECHNTKITWLIDWLNCVARFVHHRMLYKCHYTKLN